MGDMSAFMIVIVVVGVLVVLVIPFAIIAGIYNSLVRKRVNCETQWAQIDVQLKRRYDLIPNLVETVKGYASHEKETFERVVKARQQAISADSVKDQGIAEGLLGGAMRQLFAVAEAYPDLKANENFLQLQNELGQTEDQIAHSRQAYNGAVRSLNTAVQSFPSNIVAGMFGFQQRDFFEVEDAQTREAPKVSFS